MLTFWNDNLFYAYLQLLVLFRSWRWDRWFIDAKMCSRNTPKTRDSTANFHSHGKMFYQFFHFEDLLKSLETQNNKSFNLQSPSKVFRTPLIFSTKNYLFSFPRILFPIQPPFLSKQCCLQKEHYETTKKTSWTQFCLLYYQKQHYKGEGEGTKSLYNWP